MEPRFPDDAVEVGRLVGAWGVKGWVRIQPFSGDPKALFSTKRWFLRPPEAAGARPSAAWPELLRVIQARDHAEAVVAQLDGIDDRTKAEALKGGRIFVSRGSFPTAADGEFYWVDLIGLSVENRAGEALGTVSGLLDTGAHSVLRVQPADAPPDAPDEKVERLIPFVAAYVDSVDLPARRIIVDWGLDY